LAGIRVARSGGNAVKNNWFRKLLVSYLPAFVIICSSLLLISYLSLMELSKRSIEKAHVALVQNINKIIDQRLDSINSLLNYEIKNNVAINHFFDDVYKNDRYYTDVMAAVAVKKLLNDNPFIDSLYLFRVPDQMVLSPSSLVSLDKFADKRFIGATLNSRVPYQWQARTMEMPKNRSADDKGKIVASIAKNVNLKNYSFLVVNVDIRQLNDLMSSMIDKDTTFVHLLDSEGRVIVSTDNDLAYSSASVIGKSIASVSSSYTGWQVSSGSKVEGAAAMVSSLLYFWMAIALITMFAGLAWFIYVSRRNYHPIQKLMGRITDLPGNEKSDSSLRESDVDEFQYIESTLTSLLEESHTLQEKYNESTVFRKKQILLSLLGLEQGEASMADMEQELAQLGFNMKNRGAVVAVVEIDGYANFIENYKKDHQLLKYVMLKAARELADNAKLPAWVEWIGHSKMTILYFPSEQHNDAAAVRQSCEQLREWIEQNLDFTVTIGIGRPALQLANIPAAFREAHNHAGYKSSLGVNRIITDAEVINRPKGELFKQLQCIRTMSQLFRAGDGQWETQFQELYADLQLQLYDYDDLTSLVQVLVSHLQKELFELPEELYAVWRDEAHPALINELEQNETLDDLLAAFRSILDQAMKKMNEIRENKSSHQLVQDIKQYIIDHFHDPDLSLTHLSEAFGLNPKYLSRLFRESFGVKFLECVTGYRMEKAQQLLVETNKTIQDIGLEVGYEHVLTFIRVFKKHTGETPGQYRKLKTDV